MADNNTNIIDNDLDASIESTEEELNSDGIEERNTINAEGGSMDILIAGIVGGSL